MSNSGAMQQKKNPFFVAAKIAVPFMLACAIMTVPAFADAIEQAKSHGETLKVLGKLIRIIRNISIPVAVVGVAWQGFNFMRNEKTAEQAIARIKVIAVAFASVFLLSTAVSIGIQTGKTGGIRWDPENPNANSLVNPHTPELGWDWLDFVDTDEFGGIVTGIDEVGDGE